MFRSTRSAAKRAALKDLVSPDNIQCPSPKVPTISKQKENVKKKTKVKVIRTQSFQETFPGRLEWKRRHFEKPVTSTPTSIAKSAASVKDVQNCFGFVDSSDSDGEKNYSTLISPIPKIKIPTPALVVPLIEKAKSSSPAAPTDLGSSIIVKEKETQSSRRSDSIPINTRAKLAVPIAKATSPPNQGLSTIIKEKETQSSRRSNSISRSTRAKSVVQNAKERSPPPPDLSSSIFVKEKEIQSRSRFPIRKNRKAKSAVQIAKARSPTPPPPDLSSSIFVDEVNEQYLRIKPSDIGNAGVEVKDFNDLLQRYNFDEDEEKEFRIDPARATKTYSNKRGSNNSSNKGLMKKSKTKPVVQTKVKKIKGANEKTKKTKPTGSKKFGKKNEYEDDDEATKQWLEMKNKEFQEILKVNLIVERSGT